MESWPPVCNILMYSHDTYGLGHIRRSMAIANHLCDYNTNVLILTGSPIAGRFPFQEQVDFVRIPGMIKKTNGDYQSLSIRIDQDQALSIRTNIILATTQTFRPNLFIVDKEPHGLKREVLPTLEWLKENSPRTKSILGLRDILDDAEVICKDWQEKSVYRSLAELYDEIWVYGERNIYDPVEEYRLPVDIHDKVVFTGYIPRAHVPPEKRRKIRQQYRIMDDDIFVLVTTGGGGDGGELIDHFIEMHQYFPATLPFKSMIVTGPFMPKDKREEARKRATCHGIKSVAFHPHMEQLMTAADVVISMGGYNTICEILTHGTPALIIPREHPRLEQFIRATCLNKLNLLDFIPWNEVNPRILREKICSLIENRDTYKKAMAAFRLSGLDVIERRIDLFKRQHSILSMPREVESMTQASTNHSPTFQGMNV
ncbi:MAG: glycosyltransferase [Desulfobacterales bacterium GWB2_56_26]|nr:MAG: glycosyltransferase [Desulfobacterales bacterium GWB2_56_26]